MAKSADGLKTLAQAIACANLWDALREEDLRRAKAALGAGADIECVADDGMTPLA